MFQKYFLIFEFLLQVNRDKKGLVGKVTEFAFGIQYIRNYIFGKAQQQVLKLTGGLYPAPLKVCRFKYSNLVLIWQNRLNLTLLTKRGLVT